MAGRGCLRVAAISVAVVYYLASNWSLMFSSFGATALGGLICGLVAVLQVRDLRFSVLALLTGSGLGWLLAYLLPNPAGTFTAVLGPSSAMLLAGLLATVMGAAIIGRAGEAAIMPITVAVLSASMVALGVAGFNAASTEPAPRSAEYSWAYGTALPLTANELFETVPRPNAQLLDEELYIVTYKGVRSGRGYYNSAHDAFNLNPGRWNTRSPLTYRQPLLTSFWGLVGSGAGVVLALTVVVAVSALLAYRALSVLDASAALVGPPILISYYMGIISQPARVLYAEPWAGAFLISAGALCALAVNSCNSHESGSGKPQILAIGASFFALLALLVRELSLGAVLFYLLVLVLDRRSRRRSLWIPLACAIVVWGAAYAVHIAHVKSCSTNDVASIYGASLTGRYFHAGLDFIVSTASWASDVAGGVPVIVFFSVCAMAGSFAVRHHYLKLMIAGLCASSFLLLGLVRTPGTFANGMPPGYWGGVFFPPILMWAPLCLMWASSRRQLS